MTQVQKVWRTYDQVVEMPQGVTAIFSKDLLTVKGPKGEISKILRFPRVYVKVDGNNLVAGTAKFSQAEKKIIHTYRAHFNNLVKGVTEGFTYKLKVVYAKFPMTVALTGNKLVVKNFLGAKVPRELIIGSDVKVIVAGENITVEGVNKETCGQTAGSIEKLTKISHFDRRVIQDGIFITEKPHVRYN
jgi:large subunit ribosomal protein L6